jgi:hypothetical protein
MSIIEKTTPKPTLAISPEASIRTHIDAAIAGLAELQKTNPLREYALATTKLSLALEALSRPRR